MYIFLKLMLKHHIRMHIIYQLYLEFKVFEPHTKKDIYCFYQNLYF